MRITSISLYLRDCATPHIQPPGLPMLYTNVRLHPALTGLLGISQNVAVFVVVATNRCRPCNHRRARLRRHGPWSADTRQLLILYNAHDAAQLRAGILASRGPGPRLRCRPGLRRHGRAFILDADGRARGTGRILLARRVDRGCEVASRNCVACESCSA